MGLTEAKLSGVALAEPGGPGVAMTTFHTDPMNLERVLRAPLLALALVLALLTSARATIINVPADQVTIQAGINSASTGDTVLVAPGYYLENISFQGKEIVVSSHFLLDRDPAFIFTTTIDGSNPANTDSASTVRIFCAGTEAPVFQGFTVTGGGGTLMLDPTEGAFDRTGGGIATRLGAPVIRFNYVHHQSDGPLKYGGGGIYLQLGNPIVENNIIVYNPGRDGCGLCLRAANAIARNNIIAFNSGGERFGGAGVYLYGGQLDGYNNTIAFNNSIVPGGGIRVAAASIYLWNSIVWGNSSVSGSSPQTHIAAGYGGTIALEYSDIEGGYPGTGNIDADPVFSNHWCFTGDGSPCIDTGDPDVALNDLPWPSVPTAARWPSRGGLRNDMGACGGPACYPLELGVIHTSGILGWVPWEADFEAESYFEADSWNWEFGDGETGTGQTITHTYDAPGLYDVTITVGHDAGETYEYTENALVHVLADTMWVGDVECAGFAPSTPVEILIQARNSATLDDIWIPVAYSGDLQLAYDGFTTTGCRTVDFGTQTEYFHDPVARTILFGLQGSPGLPPGSGPILNLLFHTVAPESGQSAAISLTSDLVGADPMFHAICGFYQPATVDGLFQCVPTSCCLGRVGDANGEGEYPDEVTLGDIMLLVDVKFISGECSKLSCISEADVNQDGGTEPTCEDHVTLGDIMTLVDFLFITGPENATLPDCL